jgi:hypothetical protein
MSISYLIMTKIVLTEVFVIGLLGGSASASRSITKDPEMRKRIENAFRKFRADVLRREADEIDRADSVWDKMF